jgi:hypothetical protein
MKTIRSTCLLALLAATALAGEPAEPTFKPDPKNPPAADFERFAEAIRQDQPPPLRELQAARKPARQAPDEAPQENKP